MGEMLRGDVLVDDDPDDCGDRNRGIVVMSATSSSSAAAAAGLAVPLDLVMGRMNIESSSSGNGGGLNDGGGGCWRCSRGQQLVL